LDAALANGLGWVLNIVLNMVQIVIIGSVIISWVNADPNNQIVQVINRLSEPIYRPLRRLTRNIPGPIDWAPMILLLIIVFLQQSLVKYLLNYGRFAGY